MAQAQEKKLYTPSEYLEFEVNSEERHEYINGEVICVTGGTPNHNQITGNFYASLNFGLKRQPYRVFVADQRIWIPQRRIYTYPDVMVVQGDLQLQQGRKDTILNPLMIVEVLSKSTRSYDKDEKFSVYRTIPTFQEYILIDQYTMQVEQYFKTGKNSWTFSEYYDANETVSLNSINFEISLEDIYDKVEFENIEVKDS
ncbi:Uma2 family endonuclease [Rivularia sp. UHCC 0363]|uniref:Uma2 family endonuclease n=1 Tax=Rivularia sp. UHCC 0363 TaxID=3110244 RepID=UPI002B2143BD|nr:Uma2 family endonuclease [Rivularia sp. UHCC 0363]MEA5596468.1 Uma2 family endonuclease [Rivularia sp. UHCC 0363]